MRPLDQQRCLPIPSRSGDLDEFVVRNAPLKGVTEPGAVHGMMRLWWNPQFGCQEHSIQKVTPSFYWFPSTLIILPLREADMFILSRLVPRRDQS